ncbi:hypothetical protein EG329_007747 [Mollisiaceae sp. DMI_Dod_QoI]|nr:hypothetical protein EG329_007747 [Helotiales sp. DMI_Dod_QoI]
MHASTSGLRPRQRTFTSCTECRRRKQRCNQAKDRPCNNCARRYPPVNCVYENASPSPLDQVMDLRGSMVAQQVLGSSVGPHPSYVQTSDMGGLPATTANNYYSVPSSGYYAAAPSRTEYGTYQGESSSSSSRGQYSAVSSASSYATADAGYYQSNQMDYSAPETHSGYYPTSDQQQGSNWLSSTGDPGAFVGSSSEDYYYVEPDPHEMPSTSRG